jgi:3-phenylpropionate/trans-cinnamate dioxygenase ferredoxin subunit
MSGEWHLVCAAEEIDEEDVRRFNHGGHSYAVYNTTSGFYATDGYCTHEKAHLGRGLVIGDIIAFTSPPARPRARRSASTWCATR